MRAANKVADVYTLCRANVIANSAAGAFIIINSGKVIFNRDSTRGAGFLALAAADTAVKANLTDLGALIVARAFNNNSRGIVDKVDNAVGTLLNAKTAAYALSGVNFGNLLFVINANRISRANLQAIAIAKASEGAESVTRIIHISATAGRNTLVLVFFLVGRAGAVTSNVSNLFNNVARFKSHNLADFSGNAVTAGNAKRGILGFALTESLSITVAARISACAAVCTGQAIADSGNLLVFLNSEENG